MASTSVTNACPFILANAGPGRYLDVEGDARPAWGRHIGLKVLIVDDNADAAQMLGMFIEELGHEVIIEHHPKRALERAHAAAPEVCLLDIGLPDMDGNELAGWLRRQPETAQSVLIAVTGYGQDQGRDTAFNAGFDHHFAKPIDSAKLVSLLSAIRKS